MKYLIIKLDLLASRDKKIKIEIKMQIYLFVRA